LPGRGRLAHCDNPPRAQISLIFVAVNSRTALLKRVLTDVSPTCLFGTASKLRLWDYRESASMLHFSGLT
ncbi:hypothetical protein, partial [Methanoregula sp.]|uniref:hypothetical protein n=1 Tax=Methanoregula sp. TaxID=2052170 RepID=UPI003BAF6183